MTKKYILNFDYNIIPMDHRLPHLIDLKLTDKTKLVFADYKEKIFKLLIWESRSINCKGNDRKGLWCVNVISGYIPKSLEKVRQEAQQMMIDVVIKFKGTEGSGKSAFTPLICKFCNKPFHGLIHHYILTGCLFRMIFKRKKIEIRDAK